MREEIEEEEEEEEEKDEEEEEHADEEEEKEEEKCQKPVEFCSGCFRMAFRSFLNAS